MRWLSTLLVVLGYTSTLLSQYKEPEICRFQGPTKRFVQAAEGYELVYQPSADPIEMGCTASLFTPQRKQIMHWDAWAFDLGINPADMTNDGHPELIITEYTGGAHCCWKYRIVDLHPKPHVAVSLDNQTTATFHETWRGKHIIFTRDGAFDYFQASHALSFFPRAYLLVTLQGLIDISSAPEFRKSFDADIAEGYRELKRLDPTGKLRKKPWDLDQPAQAEEIRHNILKIVLSYLYSRRPNEAWRALKELWPDSEVATLKREILATRRSGVLKNALPPTNEILRQENAR